MKLLLCLPFLLWFVGCAVGPRFETADVAMELTPPAAAEQGDAAAGQRVLWAGVVINSTNLPDATRLEVLGYPLDNTQAPNVNAAPTGRFLVYQEGYLETVDYRPGRRVTVVGVIDEVLEGTVGETRYLYPVVKPDRIHLWDPARAASQPRVHFGVGVVFGR